MNMWNQMYGGQADQPRPNRAERRARERKERSQQRRAQRAFDRKVKAKNKETDES